MLGGEQQRTAGRQRLVNGGEQRRHVGQIVQRQRAIDQLAAVGGQGKRLKIFAAIADTFAAGHFAGAIQHTAGEIQPVHPRGALVAGPAAKPAVAAAKIDDA